MNYRELIEWAGGCWHEWKKIKSSCEWDEFSGCNTHIYVCPKCGEETENVTIFDINGIVPLYTQNPVEWEGYGWLSERMTEMGVWNKFFLHLTDIPFKETYHNTPEHYAVQHVTSWEQLSPADRVSLIDEWRKTL